jgi:hypothetical protein
MDIEIKNRLAESFIEFFKAKPEDEAMKLREKLVLEGLRDLLNLEDTTIDINQFASKYYVDNPRIHVTYCIIGNSNVIRMVNTHDNVEKKFNLKLVTKAINIILLEKDRRTEIKFQRMENRCDDMIGRITAVIKKEKGYELKIL